ncbi:MAG: fibronectin type III domain-containing protein [Actinomycetota bacterium]
MRYEVAESGSGVRTVEVRFRDPAGAIRTLSSTSASGEAVGTVGQYWPGGHYTLTEVAVSDLAGNAVRYFPDGQAVTTPSGATGPTSHGFALSTLDFDVANPNGDVTAPSLEAVTRTTPLCLSAGQTAVVSFAADDAGSGLVEAVFTFVDQSGILGNQPGTPVASATWTGGPQVVTVPLGGDAKLGAYQLDRIDLTDRQGNIASYHSDGTVTVDPAGAQSPAHHSVDLSAVTFHAVTRNTFLDASFNCGGRATLSTSGTAEPKAVGVDSQGRVVVIGSESIAGVGDHFLVARFLPDGSRDDTFGASGNSRVQFGDPQPGSTIVSSPGEAGAVQADDKIVVAGSAYAGGRNGFAVARFLPNGALDPEFGTDGVTLTSISSHDAPRALTLQPDGRILVAGWGSGGFSIARYNTDGSLDTTFAGDGATIIPAPGVGAVAHAIATGPGGSIFLAGSVSDGGYDSNFVVAKLTADGALADDFGGGIVVSNLGGNDFATGVLLQPDGKVVATGWTSGSSYSAFAVRRYNTDGSDDVTFAGSGGTTISFPQSTWVSTPPAYAEASALSADGRIVIAGTAITSYGGDFALARLHPDGSLDESLDGDGRLHIDFTEGGSNDTGTALAVAPDGRLFIAGIVTVSQSWAGLVAVRPFGLLTTPAAVEDVRATPADRAVTVTWKAPLEDGGSPITAYEVTASPGGATYRVAGNQRSVAVAGLVNGVPYTFSVRARNAVGFGPATATPPSTPRTLPAAPRDLAIATSQTAVTVRWSAPAGTGGAPITGYVVTVASGGSTLKTQSVAAHATSAVLPDLSPGTYTVTVAARNEAGIGPSASTPYTVAPIVQPANPPTNPPAPPAQPPTTTGSRSGYWMVGSDGAVYGFGDAKNLGNAPVGSATAVDLEPTPSGNGYWIVDDLGRVYTFGDAVFHGNVERAKLAAGEKVTSLSATSGGGGYWIFTSRGRVVTFGNAPFLGDVANVALAGPVLDSIVTPSGQGYYMVASDGGIFAFGDANFYGSMGGQRLNAPVQSLVPDSDGVGYWLVASDGGIFAFQAGFKGSMGGTRLNKPVTGMVRAGSGYLMVGEDGGIFDFSGDPNSFKGSLGANPPARPITSVAVLEI